MDNGQTPAPDAPIHPPQFPSGALAPPARTLMDILQATAEAHPDAPAIDDGQRVESYAELLDEVKDKARRLHEQGLGAGDRIGVRVESGTRHLYEWILAIMWIGAAYVPVDADDPDERAKTVFTEAQVSGIVKGTDTIVASAQRPKPFPAPRMPGLEDDAWIIFTSGSTGKPKGVAVTHRSAAAFVDAEAKMFLPGDPLNTTDRVLAGLSVAFDASCEEMWIAWRNGSCLVPAPRALVRSGMDLGPWLISRSITAVSTVPTLAALWPAQALETVRLLIFGGEACPPELAGRLATEGREVWNTYGPTEATVVACGATMDGSVPVRIGLPLDGWDLAVVDPDGIPVAERESGELIIGGVGLARYLDPEKDAEKYAPMPTLGWDRAYRSGDMVVNDPLGLIFIGRVDDQVKIGGRRIELGEIDAALNSLPEVSSAAVAVRETATGNKVLVGYLQAAADYDLAAARTTLLTDLPAPMVPILAVMDTLPMKTSGKVDRNALPWPLPGAGDDADAGSLPELDGTGQFIAEAWRGALGAPATGMDADFFASGGGSLAAAQLVSALRARYPDLTVAQLYDYPRFGALVEYLGGQQQAAAPAEPRTVTRTKRGTQWAQSLVSIPLFILSGLRWFTYLMLGHLLLLALGVFEAALPVPWYVLAGLWLVFVTPIGRMGLSIAATKLLLRGLVPGTYPRSGSMHLRLWLAQHIADVVDPVSLASAPLLPWYARMLGAKIDRTATLHTLPPVTGLLTVGPGATIEPEVDVSGYWIDGDKLHVGAIEVGAHASIGARSTLAPGASIGAHTIVEAGSAIYGPARSHSRYAGSPAQREGKAKPKWPLAEPEYKKLPRVLGGLGSLALNLAQWIPVIAALLAIAPMLRSAQSLTGIGWLFIPAVALGAAVWFLSTMVVVIVIIRLLSIGLVEGWHPVTSRVGWQAWATERVLDTARDQLFPLYASLFTPIWLRLLGAKVGRDVEISTVLLIPKMTTISSGAFLADDTMVASYELGGGWMHIAPVRVGKKAFLGNSGILHAGRRVPKRSLIAVLSATPKKMKAGTSWIGSPPHKLRRTTVEGNSDLTYRPTLKLKVMRAAWELTRGLAVLTTVAIAGGVLFALSALASYAGPLAAILLSGAVLVAAGAIAALVAVAAKWLVVGVIRPGEHALWSSFIWRTEMVDSFTELVCAQWFARLASGTPALVWFLRAQGAKIGHGVWCESYWFPEADLVTLEDHATVNRGCVLQTHLFHDRIMSIDAVSLGAGATLGPHSVILPAARICEGTTTGPASLVLRGEVLPANTYWRGNPAVRWNIEHPRGAEQPVDQQA
ncbi:Pls/PosA family non-ribosomal peptide synthetase [Glutamicibacter nicotianae]|uniref:Pls/PosA family non-ribosomal peptide synthetase n=1 Tax=Glutamicibacter nicotianae TaxID=37929 RepID=UPI0019596581|nr:Pls/PosA family non-ribosomal peptide synthetase [Glutamicibacter nicotianae]MBM7767996.1 non-ribosomal peptide synthetase-like protein [Glutamicibacter nicotianae]